MRIVFALTLFLSCHQLFSQTGSMTDPRDGKVYKTVQIGSQVWMAENLTFIEGDGFVPATKESMENKEVELTVAYNQDSANLKKFGRLYTWKAAQKACPTGWHLPKEQEYSKLIYSVGGAENGYSELVNNWGQERIFAGRLYMTEDLIVQRFINLNKDGLFWTSTKTERYAMVFTVNMKRKRIKMNDQMKTCGLSVRCIKD